MKSTGITRKIDELGRVVLPIELRRTLNISERDPVEIYVDKDSIVLKKHQITCVFCYAPENLIAFSGKTLCPKCLESLKQI